MTRFCKALLEKIAYFSLLLADDRPGESSALCEPSPANLGDISTLLSVITLQLLLAKHERRYSYSCTTKYTPGVASISRILHLQRRVCVSAAALRSVPRGTSSHDLIRIIRSYDNPSPLMRRHTIQHCSHFDVSRTQIDIDKFLAIRFDKSARDLSIPI